MRKTILKISIILFWFSASSFSQDFSSLWQAHYSYNNIVDVVSGENKIYAAAQNAVFEYDTSTNEITTITTIDGLSGEQITTIYYSEVYQYLVIGYETGLIELYSETEREVLTVVDILEKQNITPVNKRINHFYENEGLVYISTDYGVSIYDLERLEFGDTYFLGDGGSQITVKQVSILNNEIYVACLNNNGVKKADLTNPNLIDFGQWQTIIIGNYQTMNTVNNKIYAVRSNNVIYEIDGVSINTPITLPLSPLDADVSGSNLIYSTTNAIYVYNENIQLVNTFQPNTDFDSDFTSAITLNESIYIGTQSLGVLSNSVSNTEIYTEILPNGPLFNETFRLNAETNVVWTSFGDYTIDLDPSPLRSRGLSYFRNDVWESIPYDDVFGAKNLSQISINPFMSNQVFISSFQDGILEINNFEPTTFYDETNSGLESLVLPGSPNFRSLRVSATKFDANGLLWSVTARLFEPLKSYDPNTGNWQSYDFSSIIQDAINDELGYFALDIDSNGTKWIGGYLNGLYAYNESISDSPLRVLNTEDQNLPISLVTSLAVDNRNQLWVGTYSGLRVLYNTSGFYEDNNPTLSSIIILEDGIPKELLEGQAITDIEVDGSNNKWIGTGDSGVFYFSSDGQTTIYHFTTDNSPLPSNRINDISVDPNNGSVYIATNKGLLSFKAGGSKPQDTLQDAFAYPNPVRPEYDVLGYNDLNDINKGVKVTGLTERVNIKITDIEGNLVAEAQSNINLRSSNTNYNFAIDGGTAIWNGKNLANSVVRTGVYLIMISDLESFETKVLKVLIVR
ncbi:type IX secretion system anionic LPS delivery protein PorZ [Winogradskyella schleiferi]|uniref:type IX secretion system anionic LPS delivery protein PorZ n=1 Tax=Winogradskyella schleiferi TaxID=2686078 RepID=UPI0015BE1112|nr:two-component regulator propeller domain-containing protein [Winogradskyella schleiferi]